MNYDVPLRDSGLVRTMTGSYPWKISDDYSTVVYITNISARKAEFIGEINYDGGKQMIDPKSLAPGETAVFDLRQIRDEQHKDKTNKSIPSNVSQGQFKWAVHDVTGGKLVLIGRAEMVSPSRHISTSYSCNDPCPPIYSGDITPDGIVDLIGSNNPLTVWETASYSSGYQMGPYSASGTWSMDNTSVASMSSPDNGHTGAFNGLAVGSSGVNVYLGTYEWYTWDGLECLDDYSSYDENADGVVTIDNLKVSVSHPLFRLMVLHLIRRGSLPLKIFC